MEQQRIVKKYKILKANRQRKLMRIVQKYLRRGWELQGGVSVSGGALMSSETYSQTIVLYQYIN